MRAAITLRLLRTPGALVFRYRDYLSPVLVLGTLLASRPSDFVAAGTLDTCAAVAGALLIVVGLGTRLLVAGQVDIRRSGVRRNVAASRLVTTGLYAYSRNPLYVANVTLIVALTLIFDSWRAYATVVPLVLLAFFAIVLLEEEFLSAKFGPQYASYCGRVRRFVPRLRGLRATLATTAIDWRRAVRREYGPAFAAVSVALALAAAKDFARSGFDRGTDVSAYAGAWIICFGVWALVRWLKKQGRLETPPLSVCVNG